VQKFVQEKKTLIIIAQRVNNQNMYVRVISKVRKKQHQNPKFGHTQAEIQKKNTAKSTLAFNGG
jgi:hypothetical protein